MPLQLAEFFRILAGADFFRLYRIEKYRRGLELIEHEQHRPDEENEKLHGNFDHPVEQQPHAALGDGAPGEVALHLRLVGAEVGKLQEQPAQDAGPHRVAVVQIEGEINRVQFAHFSGDVGGFQK